MRTKLVKIINGPVFLRPLEFGADIVLHSTTKYLSGHNQLIGGVVITDREDIFEEMKFIQKTIGSVNVQRSYRDGEETKFVSSFGLSDLPTAIRVLQLAQAHVEGKEAQSD